MEQFEKYINISLKYLSYRPRSEKEVRDNLKRKKTSPDIIELVITKLKEQNFLNDADFVKWWIEQRTIFQTRGLHLIKRELLQKGITKELIDSQFHDLASDIPNDLERARKLAKKRMERLKNIPLKKLYERLVSFLRMKGFDFDIISKVVDEVLQKKV